MCRWVIFGGPLATFSSADFQHLTSSTAPRGKTEGVCGERVVKVMWSPLLGRLCLLLFNSGCGLLLHELFQAWQVNPHAPTNPRCLQLSGAHIAPNGRMRESAESLRLWVRDPFLFDRCFQQCCSFLCLLFLSTHGRHDMVHRKEPSECAHEQTSGDYGG